MLSNKPRVSVVMSEYNTNIELLKSALESILCQSFKDFELIIVNDGSSTDIQSLISSYEDNRIRIVNNLANKGLVYSLNRGVNIARAKYVVRMDTDDIAHSNRIEVLYEFIENNPQYAVVGSLANLLTDGEYGGVMGDAGEITARAIMRGSAPIHPSVIMNRSKVIKAGGYDDFKRAEDLALWLKLLKRGEQLYVLRDILLDYRVNKDDYRKRRLITRSGEIRARIKYYPLLGAGPIEYLVILRSIISGVMPRSMAAWYTGVRALNRSREFKDDI